jgi:hypothetical protein
VEFLGWPAVSTTQLTCGLARPSILGDFGGLALPFASETNARKNSNQREALAQPR